MNSSDFISYLMRLACFCSRETINWHTNRFWKPRKIEKKSKLSSSHNRKSVWSKLWSLKVPNIGPLRAVHFHQKFPRCVREKLDMGGIKPWTLYYSPQLSKWVNDFVWNRLNLNYVIWTMEVFSIYALFLQGIDGKSTRFSSFLFLLCMRNSDQFFFTCTDSFHIWVFVKLGNSEPNWS